MKRFLLLCSLAAAAYAGELRPRLEVRLDSKLGQLRAVPLQLTPGAPPALLLVYGQDVVIDPFHEMFYYPTGTLNLAVVSEGRILWKRDLGRSIIPGTWFCPVFPFDLDGDGTDEIWFVDNVDPEHPLSLRGQRLARLNARDGKTMGSYPWPTVTPSTMSHTYRNFILGGYAGSKPVLVTAQGTYAAMALQAWSPDMRMRWKYSIPEGPGPRGSHQTPVVDFDGDGVDELLWGERRIRIDTGEQIACGDCESYDGHSDVIQPLLDWARNRWFYYTCRETDQKRSPRIALFDEKGARVWGDVDKGHMDAGWVAQFKNGPVALAIRIDSKKLGPKGLVRGGVEEFTWNALTGKPLKLPFPGTGAIPVDLDGDGYHELAFGGAEGKALDSAGKVVGTFTGTVAAASKLLNLPGEQLLTYTKDGVVRIWSADGAQDSARALKRYAHPFYRANQRLSAAASNHGNLGGL